MGSHAYIGASDGIYRLENGSLEPLSLRGKRFWSIYAFRGGNGDDVILAGSYGDGIFRSTDSGESWDAANDGLSATALRTIQPDPTRPGAIICGTEPARGFRSLDGGQSWSEMTGIADLPTCPDWYLPYSPRAGALRNFYSPPGEDDRLLGAIEVGGLLNSTDGGETWELLDIAPDDDIHYVTGHPDDASLLFAALGWASLDHDRRREESPPLGGVARSDDGGRTWRKFFSDYTRAVLVPPARPDLLLAGPAERVGAQGRIEVSSDGGESWKPAATGIETPMNDMVEIFMPGPDGTIWAICSGGRLLRAHPDEWQWETINDPAQSGIDVESLSFVNGSLAIR